MKNFSLLLRLPAGVAGPLLGRALVASMQTLPSSTVNSATVSG